MSPGAGARDHRSVVSLELDPPLGGPDPAGLSPAGRALCATPSGLGQYLWGLAFLFSGLQMAPSNRQTSRSSL